jgi:hypothetical protein
MALKTQSQLNWNEIDPRTLEPDAKEAYDKLLAIQAKAKASREAFEKQFAKAVRLPASQRLVFSYKFGRLSVAIADAKPMSVGRKAIHLESLKAAVRREE